MTRHGKIARFPYDIRARLNLRLRDGEPGKKLVQRLNSLPEVRQVLKEQFDGHPLTEQNLSEWKQGGYQDWLPQHEASLRFVEDFVRQFSQLRRDHHRAAGLAIERGRWNRESLAQDEDLEKRRSEAVKRRACDSIWATLKLNPLAQLFGGGERGLQTATFLLETQHGLKPGVLGHSAPAPPPQTWVTPNPTKSD